MLKLLRWMLRKFLFLSSVLFGRYYSANCCPFLLWLLWQILVADDAAWIAQQSDWTCVLYNNVPSADVVEAFHETSSLIYARCGVCYYITTVCVSKPVCVENLTARFVALFTCCRTHNLCSMNLWQHSFFFVCVSWIINGQPRNSIFICRV